jgi:acid phosphatase class B
MLTDYITVETIKGRSYKYDKADEELVSQHVWSTPPDGYVKEYWQKKIDGKRIAKVVYMHRLIMNAQKGEIVDHINGDTRDNRRSNLRIVNKSHNALNSPKIRNKTGYRCVGWSNKMQKYTSRIHVNKKSIHIGYFDKAEDAAAAYLKKQKEILDELSVPNTVG